MSGPGQKIRKALQEGIRMNRKLIAFLAVLVFAVAAVSAQTATKYFVAH